MNAYIRGFFFSLIFLDISFPCLSTLITMVFNVSFFVLLVPHSWLVDDFPGILFYHFVGN